MQNAGHGTVLASEHLGAQPALRAAALVFICIVTASALTSIWQKNPAEPPAQQHSPGAL
jgi:hypothetical protein